MNLTQEAFTSGELSPKVLGRKSSDRYAFGLKKCRNAIPSLYGPVSARHGTLFARAALDTISDSSILVPFVQGRALAWQVEFGNGTLRVLNADGTDSGIALLSPYSSAQLATLDWVQSDATLWLFHDDVPTQRLQRLSASLWVIGPAQFTQEPFAEQGMKPATTLTLSLATVGAGRTATAGASTFLPSDVGRAILMDPGIAVITGYTSATVVTVEITRAFLSVSLASGTWTMDSSPQIGLMPFGKGPVGTQLDLITAASRDVSITLSALTGSITISAASNAFTAGDSGKIFCAGVGRGPITFVTSTQITVAASVDFDSKSYSGGAWAVQDSGWRSSDVGSLVRVNGGLVKINGYISDSQVTGIVRRELTAAALAPALSWGLEASVWSASGGYPRTGTIYQQRLVLGGTRAFPRTVWGSRSGELLDFERWTNDDDAFAFTIDSDDATAITYITATQELVVLTESGEYSMRGGVEKPITPTSVRVKLESNHGTAQVRPVQINRETMFVQRAGRKVRAFGYRYDFDGFTSPDISALAEHLTVSGIRWMTYCQEPDQVLWATRSDGKLLTCTIDRDQQPSVIAWAQHETDGFVECVSVIPDGDRERVWLIVRRTVLGAQVRYIERLDDTFEAVEGAVYGCTVDCGAAFDTPSGQTTFSVPHLAGCEVDILADGTVQERKTVPSSGAVTLPRKSYRTLIGLPRAATELTLLTPEAQGPQGSVQGKAMRSASVLLDVLDSIGGKVYANGGEADVIPARNFGTQVLDQPPELVTGLFPVTKLGWNKGFTEITIVQDKPLPFTLRAVVRGFQTGG